jgi:hypothetical protein
LLDPLSHQQIVPLSARTASALATVDGQEGAVGEPAVYMRVYKCATAVRLAFLPQAIDTKEKHILANFLFEKYAGLNS